MTKQLNILGQVELITSDNPLRTVNQSRDRRLLAVLGCHGGQLVGADRLADVLQLSQAGLRTRVYRLRQLIGDDVVVTQSPGYRLDDVELDSKQFERARAQALAKSGDDRISAFQTALALWRGDALVEFAHEHWAAGEAARLNELRADCEDALAESFIDGLQFSEAVASLEGVISRHPYRDRSRRLLMLALAESGRVSEALSSYQRYRELLIDETGTEPSDAAAELDRDIATGAFLGGSTSEAGHTDLPSGVVTFLFVDAATPGSDSPAEPDGAEAKQFVWRETVRLIFAERRGVAAEGQSETIGAAFDHPADAVEAAASIQRRHHSESAGDGVALRVGLHTGLAYERQKGYQGPTPTRASRIMEVAEPGQILLSATTARLVSDLSRVAHLGFRRAGDHRLQDLLEPMELVELMWDESEDGVSNNQPASEVPNNVPSVRQKLVGRDEDVTTVRQRLRSHRLVTLVGPGGSGKSALALEVAANSFGEYLGGVFVAELASLNDPARLAAALSSAVGLSHEGDATTQATVARALQRRSVLLVIDNAEHLLDDVASFVEELLAVDGPTIVVTSREWLDVRGENTYHVPPLRSIARSGRSFAAELFLAQTSAAGVSGLDTQSEAPIIETMCGRLDHLPLAIELAAGAAIHLMPSQILELLESGESLPTRRRKNRGRRFTSVDEMIEHSFELLDQSGQMLCLAMAAFRGPAPAVAIQAVLGWSAAALSDSLSRLVATSLLVAEPHKGATQYKQLQTVRDFALNRARASGTHGLNQRAHRDWYLEWSESRSVLERHASTAWALELESQLPNFRVALEFSASASDVVAVRRQATALVNVWFTFLLGDEGLGWLQFGAHPTASEDEQLRLVVSRLSVAFASERWDQVMALTPELTILIEDTEQDVAVLGIALWGLINAHRYDFAMEQMRRARALEDTIHSGFGPLVEHLSADVQMGRGRFELAGTQYRRVSSSLDPREFAWWVSSALAGSALSFHALGKSLQALPLAEKSLQIVTDMPDSLGGVTRAVSIIAAIKCDLGDIETARGDIDRQLDRVERRTQRPSLLAEPFVGIVHVAIATGDFAFAAQLLELSVRFGGNERSPWQSALSRLARGKLEGVEALEFLPFETLDDGLAACRIFLSSGVRSE